MTKQALATINTMREFSAITKALADETRVRLLMALANGELCVCQLTELVKLAPSTVSKHMAILRQAGLVESRKDGRWIYYRQPEDRVLPAAGRALSWTRQALADDAQIANDQRTLKTILKTDPEVLCRRQTRN
jgi:DNA-binding transcriptional ArsR family regulator